MPDPYAAAPEPYAAVPDLPPERSRAGLVGLLLSLFALGFAGVTALLFLRAPEGPADSQLGHVLVAPPGYTRLDDAAAGGGRLSESRAAAVLGTGDVPGFVDGVLRAWGRPPGEPPRAVVVLAVQVGTPGEATALLTDYVATAVAAGGTRFDTPPDLRASGFHAVPDRSERHAQRVAFTRGARLFVVSIVSPARERDTGEVVRLATAQAAAT